MCIRDSFQITHPDAEAKALSPLVGIPLATLIPLLSEHSGYVVINDALDLTDGRRIAALSFPGVVVENSSVRTYPDGTLATSLLGGVNASGAGSTGLE